MTGNAYRKSAGEVFSSLNAEDCGLSQDEAEERRERHGLNEIADDSGRSLEDIAINQFTDPLIYLLIAAGIVTTAVGHLIDSAVIAAVVAINAAVGFAQEYKAEKAMAEIRKLAAPKAKVLRDCDTTRIPAADVVPGDVVVLAAGDKVPADARLFSVTDLTVDESTFTGESTPVEKQTNAIDDEDVPVAEQENMTFMGTTVTRGKGRGVVTATGEDTELGGISAQMNATERRKTPLQQRVADFSRRIGAVSVALAVFVVLVGVARGMDVVETALFSIGLAVSVIPAGLPIAMTLAMAIGLKRMASRNAIIRRLVAVETLGSCDYICSDKTGTITENSMTVKRIHTGDASYDVAGEGYAPEGAITYEGEDEPGRERLRELLTAGVLCNDSDLVHEEDEWTIDGDPTEGALLVAAKKEGLDLQEIRRDLRRRDEIPFSSERKYMASLNERDGGCTVYVKGAPETVLGFLGEDEGNEGIRGRYEAMASDGLRVLALAKKDLKGTCDDVDLEDEATTGLSYLGLAGSIDPARESAVSAIKDTKSAGITTVMITGDHRITATAIAKSIGILEDDGEVVTGRELAEKGKGFLADRVQSIAAYARVSPDQKVSIVKALQERGHVVAVTGDGVNDAPALKKASIGVSMGKKGTDVAREASDMVLQDDNFATIFEAVRVGRTIFVNIRKVVFFLLSSSAGVALFILASLFGGLPLPFFATQILWINLVTNGLQDVALAYEPAEEGITKRSPRDPKEPLFNRFMVKRLALVGLVIAAGTFYLFYEQLATGASPELARTTALNAVVFFQFFHTLNSRSFTQSVFRMNPLGNPFLLGSLFVATCAQLAVIYVPDLQYVMRTTALDPATWAKTLAIAASIVVVVEADKYLRRQRGTTPASLA